jgi:hypothetical protein
LQGLRFFDDEDSCHGLLGFDAMWFCGHVNAVPRHNGMAPPEVADGGDDLQMWRVAVNILNKQLRTADKGWSSSLGVEGLTTPYRKNQLVTKCHKRPRIWMHLAQDMD